MRRDNTTEERKLRPPAPKGPGCFIDGILFAVSDHGDGDPARGLRRKYIDPGVHR
jgi:hypothetical protein